MGGTGNTCGDREAQGNVVSYSTHVFEYLNPRVHTQVPATLQHLGFTHRRYHAPPCHPSLTITLLLLYYITVTDDINQYQLQFTDDIK